MSQKKFNLNRTELMPGEKTLQESVAFCTRCNACAQDCPAYLLHKEEVFSPRGRTQFLRLLIERKLKPENHAKLIQDITRSCLLCARCSAACAGHIPVAKYMTALRRAANIQLLPVGLKTFMHLRHTYPTFFEFLVRAGKILHRLHLLPALSLLPGLSWLCHTADILPRKSKTLRQKLYKQKIDFLPAKPDILYLPSLEAQYIDTNIALLTLQLLKSKKTRVLFGLSSGLFEHIYGDEILRLKTARKLLTEWEKYNAVPMVTDNIDVYHFLKNYPLLFASLPGWKDRAEKFAKHIKYVTDFPFPRLNHTENIKTALDASVALTPATTTTERAQKILKTLLGKNLVECEYSRFPIASAGQAFIAGSIAYTTRIENVKDVAQRQIQQVYCLSGLSALELNAALRRHYPTANAQHIVYLQANYDRI